MAPESWYVHRVDINALGDRMLTGERFAPDEYRAGCNKTLPAITKL